MSRCLLFAMVFAGFVLPVSGQENVTGGDASSTPRMVEEIAQELKAIGEKDLDYGPWIREMVEFVRTLSINEVKDYLDRFPDQLSTGVGEMMIEQWAYHDPSEVIQRSEEEVDKILRRGEDNARGVDFHLLHDEWVTFNAMMSGWSRRDPHGAWAAIKEPDGRVANLFSIFDHEDSLAYTTLEILMNELAQLKPELAWVEYENYPQRKFDRVYRESMLEGISSGLPDASPWQEYLEKAIALAGSDIDRLAYPIREQLFSRWLAQDPESAENWFRSERGVAIAMETKTVSLDSALMRFLTSGRREVEVRYEASVSMMPAIAIWIARDSDGALNWLRARKEKARELLDLMGNEYKNWRCQVSEENMRKLMTTCFSREERHAILKKALKEEAGFRGHFLEKFCWMGEKEEMRKSLQELDISPIIVELMIKKIRGN